LLTNPKSCSFSISSLSLALSFAGSLACVFVVLLTSLPVWSAPSLIDTWKNNRAIQDMNQKKVLEGFEKLSDLAVRNPEEPLFQFNLGTAFIAVEQKEKSLKMLRDLASSAEVLDPVLFFSVHYNLGVLYSDKDLFDLDKALEHYQMALLVNPTSIEVKTNIELLFQGGGGQGQGDGEGEEGDQDQEEGEQPEEPQEFTNKPKKQPNQFDSKDMSKQDVNQILEELKNQEQNIRAKYDRKGKKEADRDKNW
jgi:Ca-activated chloride channel homolog